MKKKTKKKSPREEEKEKKTRGSRNWRKSFEALGGGVEKT